jgi:hypothetical protein
MNEKPLERLNYYNGQRLEASDFKTEQDYHIRTKRWLNKSLYSAGIARGLDVREALGSPTVMVSPGLALDSEGREIILLEETPVEVISYAGTNESTVVGNYLVIEYAEETIAYEKNGCAVRAEGTSANKSTKNWGGPSRIQAQVKFSWVPFVPHPGSNQIVLARVELADGCKTVHQIDTGARRYIGAASAATVRQYALEGERHIDNENPGRIYFHIRGRQPNSVTLYLRAEKFSTLYYTEMGWHEHAKSLTGNTATGPANTVDNHTHSPSTSMKTEYEFPDIDESPAGTTAEVSGQHTGKHQVWASVSARLDPEPSPGFLEFFTNPLGALVDSISNAIRGTPEYPPNPNPLPNDTMPYSPYALRVVTKSESKYIDLGGSVGMGVFYGKHQHAIVGKTGNPEDKPVQNDLHTHGLSTTLTIDAAGVNPEGHTEYKARGGQAEKALTYVDNLQVLMGDSVPRLQNKTGVILEQLRDAQAGVTWDKLGNGSDSHVLAIMGTNGVRLDFLPGVTFSEGEYVIELRVASGGGRILYNLYVE